MTIPYDPTRQGLYHPELRPPLAMTLEWPADAVAAEFSRLAYFRFEDDAAASDQVTRAVGAIGFAKPGWFAREGSRFDAQGFAAMNAARHAIVAFRGTQADSFRDLATDALFVPRAWDGPGRVHSGFWESLETIIGEVYDWLEQVQPARLTITGHSLGAAMATLLAALRIDATLVTFGSPRVGDPAFGASLNGRTIRRYVDTTDEVTTVPPAQLTYEHVGALRYIDSAGRVHDELLSRPQLEADHEAARRAYAPERWKWRNVHARSLADHAPINYVSAVLNVRTGP